ncbi:MAG: hypothetical protein IKO61_05170 [Lachnospiraceae bacterium]|nr:hypothetical protein [Lachnospiraceae bacterium]
MEELDVKKALKKEERMLVNSMYDVQLKNSQLYGDSEFAYRDMNSRYIALEQAALQGDKRAEKLREHKQRKKEIEALWHSTATVKANTLLRRAEEDQDEDPAEVIVTDKRKKEFYDRYSMEDMEVLLKGNVWGSNSQAYNDVVTDLELFNGLERGKKDTSEVRKRLVESCEKYLHKKHPITSKGKIRKAMIERVYEKFNISKSGAADESDDVTLGAESLIAEKKQPFETAIASIERMKHAQGGIEAVPEDKLVEMVNSAFKAHIEAVLSSQTRSGGFTPAQKKEIDTNLDQLLRLLSHEKVAPGQADKLSVKFMNAMGISGVVPAGQEKAVSMEQLKRDAQTTFMSSYPALYTFVNKACEKDPANYIIFATLLGYNQING